MAQRHKVTGMTAAPVNGITIEYDVHGEEAGDPLLLVMGLGGQLVAWPDDFVARLVARGFRVVRFDNRDVGLSSRIDGKVPTRRQLVLATLSRRFAKSSYLIADMADDAAGLLDHLGIPKAHVVGASMGGMIGQTIAIRHPERVTSLTSIMSNTGDRKNGKPSTALLRKLPKLTMRNDDADAIDAGVEVMRLVSGPLFDPVLARQATKIAVERSLDPAGAARQTMAISASPDRTEALGSVTAPTLVIHGLADPLVKPSGGIATARAIHGSRLVMYPEMGHDLPRPLWDDVIDEIARNAARAPISAPAAAASSVAG